MVMSWPLTLMDQGPHGYVWISYRAVYLWWKIIYKPNKNKYLPQLSSMEKHLLSM